MEISDYLRILRKRGWLIVVVAIIAAASAYAFSKMQTPIYSATVQLSVNPARLDWGLSNTIKDLLRNYATNIRTHAAHFAQSRERMHRIGMPSSSAMFSATLKIAHTCARSDGEFSLCGNVRRVK